MRNVQVEYNEDTYADDLSDLCAVSMHTMGAKICLRVLPGAVSDSTPPPDLRSAVDGALCRISLFILDPLSTNNPVLTFPFTTPHTHSLTSELKLETILDSEA